MNFVARIDKERDEQDAGDQIEDPAFLVLQNCSFSLFAFLWYGGDLREGVGFAGSNAAVEFVDDAGDIEARFAVRRDAVPAIDSGGAGVVGGEREGEIVVVALEQAVEVGGSAVYVLAGREGVGYSELGGSARHELHEALGSGAAYGVGVVAALFADNGGEQVGVEVVLRSGGGYKLMQLGFGQFFFVLLLGGSGGWSSDGYRLAGYYLTGVYFYEACGSCVEVEADLCCIFGGSAVVADEVESVGKRDVLGGSRGQGRGGKQGEGGDDGLGGAARHQGNSIISRLGFCQRMGPASVGLLTGRGWHRVRSQSPRLRRRRRWLR